MTIQISVRLPAALVQRLDEAVDEGVAETRADVVARALEREFRRLAAERDVELLSEPTDPAEQAPESALTPVPRRAWVG
ncbi:MAG: antitoxin [Propionibacteriaceae bacterium]|nr:antitoxin [Propionibacteriaceae bacterium]